MNTIVIQYLQNKLNCTQKNLFLFFNLGKMGLGYEGLKGEKGHKGQQGPPGPSVPGTSLEAGNGTIIGPKGEPGEKGNPV